MHFRELFRERVCGSNFAVRMLCACLLFATQGGTRQEFMSKHARILSASQAAMSTAVEFAITISSDRITLEPKFWEGDATKRKSVKRSAFSLNGVWAFSE